MKKSVLTIMVLVLGFSTFSYSRDYNNNRYNERNKYRENDYYKNDRNARDRKYDQIYSRYESKINLLYDRLDQKNNDLRYERRGKRTDYGKIDRLNNERNIIIRELDYTYADLRRELERNNLYGYSIPRR